MSRTKSALWGFVADIGGQIVTQALAFVFIPIYLNYISEKSYGCWLTIGSIMTWIAISDVGIGMALNRYLMSVHVMEANERYSRINKLINTSFAMFLCIAIVFCLVGAAVFPFTLKWFNIDSSIYEEYRNTYVISVLAGALSLPLYVFNGTIESYQKIALNRNINTIAGIANVFIALVLIIYTRNAASLAIALLCTIIIRGIVSYYYAYKLCRFKWSIKNYDRDCAKQLLSFGGYFQISRIANTVAENTDNLFIAGYLNTSAVPLYSFSAKLPQLFGITISSKIAISMFSGISQIIDQNNYDKLREVFAILVNILFRFLLYAAGFTLFFNKDFITLWVGEKYYGGDALNLVFVYWVFYETFFRGTTIIVYALKEVKGLAIASIFEAIINAALSIILIQKYGLIGVAVATSIGRTLTSGVFIMYVYFKYKLVDIGTFKIVLRTFLFSLPTIVFFYLASHVFKTGVSWNNLIIYSMIGVIINFLSFESRVLYEQRGKPLKVIFKSLIEHIIKGR